MEPGHLLFLGIGITFRSIDFGYFRILNRDGAAATGIFQFDGAALFLADFLDVVSLCYLRIESYIQIWFQLSKPMEQNFNDKTKITNK